MDKRNLRKLMGSIFSLVLTGFIFVAATFAWMTIVKVDNVTGMQLSVDASSNLVISDDKSNISAQNYLTNELSFTSVSEVFLPCTHDSDDTFALSGLKYVTNTDQINFLTGIKSDIGEELDYEVAKNSEDEKYYFERTVFVASNGKAIENTNLSVSITSAKVDGVEVESGCLMATSVDVYLIENGTATYCNKSCVAEKESVLILQNGTVPLNTSGSLEILIRYYFDGALLKESGKAYINSATVNVKQVSLNLTFIAE